MCLFRVCGSKVAAIPIYWSGLGCLLCQVFAFAAPLIWPVNARGDKLGDYHGIPVHLYFFRTCARVELACDEKWHQAIKSIGHLFWHFVVDAVYNDFFVN